jgi:hypothetical protein
MNTDGLLTMWEAAPAAECVNAQTFPKVVKLAPKVMGAIDKLERDHRASENADPLTGHYPRAQEFEKLFSLIVTRAPSPVGLG